MLFLPVFAQFATVMFFLAGLGLLNVVWLPVLEAGFDTGQLGDIVYLPYRALRWAVAPLGIDIHGPVVALLVGGGLFLFTLGTLAWFAARFRGRDVADFWVYRVSRHPQYLGWILWSYGMLLALERVQYPRRSWALPASLPFMLSAVVIVGVALMEEQRMRRAFGDAYERFRARTPFLVPLPKWLARTLSAPSRFLFGTDLPQRGGQIAALLALFTVVLMGASYLSLELRRASGLPPAVRHAADGEARAEALVDAIRRADGWRTRAPLVRALQDLGEPAVRPLAGLLADPDPALRQLAARGLGRTGSDRAVKPLIGRLADPSADVRHWAAVALGDLGAGTAVEPLIDLLEEDAGTLRLAAAGALGRIDAAEAVAPLVEALGDPRPWTRAAVVEALGAIGSEDAVEPLLALLDDRTEAVHVRRAVVVALSQIRSSRAGPALRRALDDPDREVRIYAAEALRTLEDAPR
jgi:protein-S-isoprenylcysteine O-methyltransferase Ste14